MTDPRCITLAEAARHCGVSVSAYRQWMARGLVPGYLPGTRRIDLRALDAALDKLSGLEQHDDPFENWISQRERRRADRSAEHSHGQKAPV